MRQINRSSLTTPHNLQTLYSNVTAHQSELATIRTTEKAKSSIYAHDDVKTALNALYKNVCYICQKSLAAGYEIEHFLPWSKHYPERAYDWHNLHKSCKFCNGKKRKVVYKQRCPSDLKKVIDMLLLCPTTEPVEQLIGFDSNTFEALDNSNQSNIKVAKTVEFLNASELVLDRSRHWHSFTNFLLSPEWSSVMLMIKNSYMNFTQIQLINNNRQDYLVGDFCYRIHNGYLSLNSPYNVFTKSVMPILTNLPIDLIKEYSRQFCINNNIAYPQ